MHNTKERLALLGLWLIPALWSVNYIVARWAPGVISPYTLALGRWAVAGVLLVAVARRELWHRTGAPGRYVVPVRGAGLLRHVGVRGLGLPGRANHGGHEHCAHLLGLSRADCRGGSAVFGRALSVAAGGGRAVGAGGRGARHRQRPMAGPGPGAVGGGRRVDRGGHGLVGGVRAAAKALAQPAGRYRAAWRPFASAAWPYCCPVRCGSWLSQRHRLGRGRQRAWC